MGLEIDFIKIKFIKLFLFFLSFSINETILLISFFLKNLLRLLYFKSFK